LADNANTGVNIVVSGTTINTFIASVSSPGTGTANTVTLTSGSGLSGGTADVFIAQVSSGITKGGPSGLDQEVKSLRQRLDSITLMLDTDWDNCEEKNGRRFPLTILPPSRGSQGVTARRVKESRLELNDEVQVIMDYHQCTAADAWALIKYRLLGLEGKIPVQTGSMSESIRFRKSAFESASAAAAAAGDSSSVVSSSSSSSGSEKPSDPPAKRGSSWF
jgi:hypothetical protein